MHLMVHELQACDLDMADWSHHQPAAIWQMGSLVLFALLCGGLCYLVTKDHSELFTGAG